MTYCVVKTNSHEIQSIGDIVGHVYAVGSEFVHVHGCINRAAEVIVEKHRANIRGIRNENGLPVRVKRKREETLKRRRGTS